MDGRLDFFFCPSSRLGAAFPACALRVASAADWASGGDRIRSAGRDRPQSTCSALRALSARTVRPRSKSRLSDTNAVSKTRRGS